MGFQLGLETLLQDKKLLSRWQGRRVGLLAHPASTDQKLHHSLDRLMAAGLKITCAFGPQHGMKGDKQDNMIETQDEIDPRLGIPVFSLYGKFRRPTPEMLEHFDVLMVDLQDVGCRIYTFLTTLFYLLEDLSQVGGKELVVLDRPNPAGRIVEGSFLEDHFYSFVGAARVPMRHGLTLGEAARWYVASRRLSVPLEVVAMSEYHPTAAPFYGWPERMPWVNPSPNMPKLSTARAYPGTVMLEGTCLSEGRGTTVPLEVFGAPGLNISEIVRGMRAEFGEWLGGCQLREMFYEPTFHKFKGELVAGLQVHADDMFYDPSRAQPYRLMAAFFRGVRRVHPKFDLWRKPPYEYETEKRPIDLISGSTFLREWVDNLSASADEFEAYLRPHEEEWREESQRYFIYR